MIDPIKLKRIKRPLIGRFIRLKDICYFTLLFSSIYLAV